MENRKSIAFLTGLSFLSIIATSLLTTILLWCLGMPVQSWVLPLITMIHLCVTSILFDKKVAYKVGSLMLLVVLISYIICTITYDYSFDGGAYHQPIIYNLISGWNPILDYTGHTVDCNPLWIYHYDKGAEYLASIFAVSFGGIEYGRMFNHILTISTFLFVKDVLSCYFINDKKVFLYSIIIAFSPVTISQFNTFYIDWTLYSLLVIFCTTAINIYVSGVTKFNKIIISITIAMAMSIKFNIAFWICLAYAVFYFLLLYKKKTQLANKFLLYSFFGGIIGVAIFGFNPYFTNILTGHHIFYPLMGAGSVEIMTEQTPIEIANNNVFISVIKSLFSRPFNELQNYQENYLIPSYSNIVAASIADARMGGFGFLFREILIVNILILIVCASRTKEYKATLIINIILFVLLFVLPSGWWARYVPFFYLAPCVTLLYCGCVSRRYHYFLATLMVINIASCCVFSTVAIIRYKNSVDNAIEQITQTSNPGLKITNKAFKYKLIENNINYTECDTATIDLNLRGGCGYVKIIK